MVESSLPSYLLSLTSPLIGAYTQRGGQRQLLEAVSPARLMP
jgi:hypothetical protein